MEVGLGLGLPMAAWMGGGLTLAALLAKPDVYTLTDPSQFTITANSGTPAYTTLFGIPAIVAAEHHSADLTTLTAQTSTQELEAFGDSHTAGTKTGNDPATWSAIIPRLGGLVRSVINNYGNGGDTQDDIDTVHSGETGTYGNPTLIQVSVNGLGTTMTEQDIVDAIAAMVARLTSTDYVVWGPMPHDTLSDAVLEALEAALAAVYGAKYLAIRPLLLADVGGQTAWEEGYTAAGDNIHTNPAGGTLAAGHLADHIAAQEWMVYGETTGLHLFAGDLACICRPDGWSGTAGSRNLYRSTDAGRRTRLRGDTGSINASRADSAGVGSIIPHGAVEFADGVGEVFIDGWEGHGGWGYDTDTLTDGFASDSKKMDVRLAVTELRIGGSFGTTDAFVGDVAMVYAHGRRFTDEERAILLALVD